MIRFENVGMRYGSGAEILKNISFDLDAGSFHFLTGPSGAGKTSLLKLMYLAERPSRGLVTMFGRDTTTLGRNDLPLLRRRLGIIFQDFRLLPHLTVFDNVAVPLRLRGERPRQYRANVIELLDWVGLGDRLNALPSTLSGGEQQRVAIARAVVGKPDLILADEPTGNVDPELGQRLLHLFKELNRQGTSILIATHDRQLIEASPDASEMRLRQGRLQTL